MRLTGEVGGLSYAPYNHVRDYNKLQGMTHPTDSHIQIVRDINYRYASLENSSRRPIGIAIRTYISNCGDLPDIDFVMKPGEIKALALNTHGGPAQFIHLLDWKTGKKVGGTTSLRRDVNQFVLRDGINGWHVDFFHMPTFRGAS